MSARRGVIIGLAWALAAIFSVDGLAGGGAALIPAGVFVVLTLLVAALLRLNTEAGR